LAGDGDGFNAEQVVPDDIRISKDGFFVLLYHGYSSEYGCWYSGLAVSRDLSKWERSERPLPDEIMFYRITGSRIRFFGIDPADSSAIVTLVPQ